MKMKWNPEASKKAGLILLIASLAAGGFSPRLLRAEPSAVNVASLYKQALELFQKANNAAAADPDEAQRLYKKAVMRFERIAGEGNIHNGKLYYDIGNTYFKMKDIGRAILNYRQAQQYIPNDGNLQQNLDFARSNRIDHIEEKQETRILKTLFFWHYDLSIRVRVYIFSFFFALMWIFASIRIFSRKAFVLWGIIPAAALAVLFAGSLFVEHIDLHKSRPGVIISHEVVARKGNSDTYESSFKDPLHAGTEFTLVENRGDWFYIELPDSRKCWVPGKDIELVR